MTHNGLAIQIVRAGKKCGTQSNDFMNDTHDFVASLSDQEVGALFVHYYRDCYNDLMRDPVVRLTTNEERNALEMYLQKFTADVPVDEERYETLREIVRTGDLQRLNRTITHGSIF